MTAPKFFQRSELTATLWSFRHEFLVVGLFSMLANLLMLTPTLYMLQVYDRVLSSQSELTLLAMSLIALLLFASMAFAEWLRSRVLVRTGLRLDERLGTQVFNASFESSLNQSSVATTRAFGDLIQVRQFFTGSGIFAFFDAPWAPIYMGVLFLLHPWLGVLGIVFALIQGLLAWVGHRHTVQPSEAASTASAEANSFLHGKLRNAEVVESMGMVENLRQRWAQRHSQALALASVAQAQTQKIMAWSKFIRYSQQSLALGAGALLVIDGQLSPGGMIAANVLMTRALTPIDQVVSGWRSFIAAGSAFARLENLLRSFPVASTRIACVELQGELVLRDIVATAPGRAKPILDHVNLTVPSGSVLVVLGPSGSGKSTLARTMMGIWPELSGDVLLDGQLLSDLDRTTLGPKLGYLPQDIELFEGTLAQNIARLGEVNAPAVIEAARCTGLHDVILRFPKGYDTPIGEAGNLLSGGQRQRIGLARAIYGNPSLIVLDEPNSNLDEIGEAALVSTLHKLKARGATVILITHRPGILAIADQLLLLADGKIQAAGPRDAVVAALQAAAAARQPTPTPASA